MRKRKLMIAGMAALVAMSMIGGTWAVWSRRLIAKNEYMTAKYSTFLRELFESPQHWLPGEEEQKAVWVENKSTIPIIAKITMTQSWVRTADVTASVVTQETEGGHIEIGEKVVAQEGQELGNTFLADEENNSYQYAAIWNLNTAPGEEVMVLSSKRAEDPGLRMQGITEVDSIEEAKGHWLMLDETPDQLGRFTFYYVGEVPAGKRTPDLLKSVTMNPLLKATVTGTHIYYEKMEDGTYRTVTEDKIQWYNDMAGGYDNCRYTLSVTMDTVQATPAGIASSQAFKDEIGEYLATSGYIKGLGYDASRTPLKVMTIRSDGDRLYYTPTRLVDGQNQPDAGNWFMSFTNMVPGENYTDTLKIENTTSDGYTVYMRIVPKADAELGTDPETIRLKRELLERIFMEVYYLDNDTARRLEQRASAGKEGGLLSPIVAWAGEGDPLIEMRGTLLYRGTSTGIYSDTDAVRDELRNLIPLGYFGPHDEGTIYVRLTLDPSIGLDEPSIERSNGLNASYDPNIALRNQEETDYEPAYKYADLLTKVDWEFLIQWDEPDNPHDPTDPTNPTNPTSPTSPTRPTEIITQPETPLTYIASNETPLAFIPDEDVPLAFLSPQTGDERPVVPLIVTVLAAFGLMCVLGYLAFGDKKEPSDGS